MFYGLGALPIDLDAEHRFEWNRDSTCAGCRPVVEWLRVIGYSAAWWGSSYHPAMHLSSPHSGTWLAAIGLVIRESLRAKQLDFSSTSRGVTQQGEK